MLYSCGICVVAAWTKHVEELSLKLDLDENELVAWLGGSSFDVRECQSTAHFSVATSSSLLLQQAWIIGAQWLKKIRAGDGVSTVPSASSPSSLSSSPSSIVCVKVAKRSPLSWK